MAKWLIYIPEEGHWSIPGVYASEAAARTGYLKWAKRQRLPAGSFICKDE